MWPAFPTLKRDIDIYACCFEHPKKRWKATLHCNNFVYTLQVIIPGVYSLPDSIRELLSAHEYQIVRSLPAKELIDYNFIDAFVKRGKVAALSMGTSITYGNCVAVTPNGLFHVSTQEETFHSLGIEGSLSSESCKTHKIYSSTIHLLRDCFFPGKRNYDSILQALGRSPSLTCDIAVLWEPPVEDFSSLSVGEYFSRKGYVVDLCTPAYTYRQLFSASVPKITAVGRDAHDLLQLHEWLSAAVCGVDCVSCEVDDEFVSSYKCPEPAEEVGHMFVGQWQGFFTPVQVLDLLRRLREYVNRDQLPFCGMIVHGHDDDPTRLLKKHHSRLIARSSECTLVILPDDEYIMFHTGIE